MEDMTFKILLIGDPRVGKSCIINRFSDSTFTSTYVTTKGVDFKLKTVKLRGKKINLKIWDSAGKERFCTVTTPHYRDAKGIVLVYDVTNERSFDNITKWLKNIDEYASEDVEKLILGNKCDMEEKRIIQKKEGEDFAREHGCQFLEASAKANINVAQAFKELAESIINKTSARKGPLRQSNLSMASNTTPLGRGESLSGAICQSLPHSNSSQEVSTSKSLDVEKHPCKVQLPDATEPEGGKARNLVSQDSLPDSQPSKTHRSEYVPLTALHELISSQLDRNFNRYYEICRTNKSSLKGTCTISMAEEIKEICGGYPRSFDFIPHTGSVLVETETQQQAENLLTLTILVKKPVTVTAYDKYNQSQGLIVAPGLKESSESEMQEALTSQHVVRVRRLNRLVCGVTKPSATFLLTFSASNLPSYVYQIGYYRRLKVRLYIPEPRRCYHCHRFGHTRLNCRLYLLNFQALCCQCARVAHTGLCRFRCPNCGGKHAASSRDCPRYKVEKEIQYLHSVTHIPFSEARNLVLGCTSSMGNTYTDMLRGAPRKPRGLQAQVPDASEE